MDDDKALVDDIETVQNLGGRYATLHEGKDFCVVVVVVVVVMGVVGAVVLMVVVVLMIVGECCVWEWWK